MNRLTRLKLANRYVWQESGGLKGFLLQFVLLFCVLGVSMGILYWPLRWIGLNLGPPPSRWLIIVCVIGVICFSPVGQYFVNVYHAILLSRHIRRENRKGNS